LAAFIPYRIHHIDIASEGLPLDFDPGLGHYLVFWWQSIPLGQLFITPGCNWSSSELTRKCLDSVWQTIQFYSERSEQTITSLEKPRDERGIKDLCSHLFNKLLDGPLPTTCPVSVIICTRDRPDYLANCLSFIMKQQCRPAEIIVVDNASKDGRTKQIASGFSNVLYVREDRPGLDIARNTGARLASQLILAYTDDDTKPQPDWVYQVIKTFDDPKVSAMTGLVIAASLDSEAQMIFEKHWPFNRGYVDKYFDQDFFQRTLPNGPPVWDLGAGANMAFRKEILEKVGYFDERLDVGAAGCSGDSELWYRILANGYAIHYNPRAVVHHFHRESLKGLQKQLYAYMRGFTVAILIQHSRFGHKGNLRHLFFNTPKYYIYLLLRGFPRYRFRFRTLLSEIRGIISGLFFYWKYRKTDPKIFIDK
jgi:GT2 family glycosyltransferase